MSASIERFPRPGNQDFYPFSIVLGTNFQPTPPYNILREGDHELRARVASLVGPSNPQALGRLVNILVDGQIRFRGIPEMEPRIYRGVTFHDPEKLYNEWPHRSNVGPVLGEMMRSLIINAAHIQLPSPSEELPTKSKIFGFLRRHRQA
ncbi:MAG TPA: hypothetical protein VG964_00010 [Candidatus Saccharimonadales bacterium]|nr:hypothetical protein [Candidatus Saccharimonadales bacterium]